jgi:hypothetical protein
MAGSIVVSQATYNGTKSNHGANLLIAGFGFQTLILLLLGLLCIEFVDTVYKSRTEVNLVTPKIQLRKRLRYFIGILLFAYACVLARCIYRVAALFTDATGGLNNQACYIVFEDL